MQTDQLNRQISDIELDNVTGGRRKSGEGQKELKATLKGLEGFAASPKVL